MRTQSMKPLHFILSGDSPQSMNRTPVVIDGLIQEILRVSSPNLEYVASLTQVGEFLVPTVLKNTTGETIVYAANVTGEWYASCDGSIFTDGRTVIRIGTVTGTVVVSATRVSGDTILISTTNSATGAGVGDVLNNVAFEIVIYPA